MRCSSSASNARVSLSRRLVSRALARSLTLRRSTSCAPTENAPARCAIRCTSLPSSIVMAGGGQCTMEREIGDTPAMLKVRPLTTHALEAIAPAWQDLAGRALEPNPFYEPWFLIPALRHVLPDQEGTIAVLAIEDRAELVG